MKYSDEALFILSLCEYLAQGKGSTKVNTLTNKSFYEKVYTKTDFSKFKEACERIYIRDGNFSNFMNNIKNDLINDSDSVNIKNFQDNYNPIKVLAKSADGMVCAYDNEFPTIYKDVDNSQKPYLLFYKGDISLLRNIHDNVAVIGTVDPDEDIIRRESTVVKKLVEKNINIVSGLALGCDTVAHKVCVDNNGKTIAIVASTLGNIYPAKNRNLAKSIVVNGGLLITEYYRKHISKNEYIGRLINRDRLQAMFSKAIILSASYDKGVGDSGSRHAMDKAKEYGLHRAMLYNEIKDKDNIRFGLNKRYYADKSVDIMSQSVLNNIINFTPAKVTDITVHKKYEQMQHELW